MPEALLLAAAALASAGAAGDAPAPPRQTELLHLLRHDCGSCHGLTMRGGLGPALLPQTLADKDEARLVEIVLDGVPGTPMPPWRFELSPDEAAWIVAVLRGGLAP